MSESDKLREQLMRSFVRDNQGTFSDITSAIKEGDIKLAHRIVHTLKSGAGFIGKTGLMEAARNVEHSLKDGEALFTEVQMNILEQELRAVLTELAPLLSKPIKCEEQSERLGAAETTALLDRLAVFLDSGDPDCLKLIDELMRIPGTENLISQMEEYEFELASAALEDIKRSLEVSINE